jgi:hypothetical protein
MALTLGRWMAGLVIGALVVAVLLVMPKPSNVRDRSDSGWERWEKYRRADAHAGRAARRLRTHQVADSVAAALSKLPRTSASRTVIGKGLEPSSPFLRPAVDRLASKRPKAAVAPMELALVYTKPVMIQGHEAASGWSDETHILPRTPGEPCITVVRFGEAFGSPSIMSEQYEWQRRRVSRRFQRADVLGACGFYESFGAPGPQIDRWLRAGAWRFGMAGPEAPENEERVRVDAALGSPWLAWAEGDFRSNFTPTGYRCLTGDASSCASVVLDPRADAKWQQHVSVAENGVIERRPTFTDNWVTGNLGPVQPAMFADMIRLMGRDRFQRFWTSEKEPGEAFQAAFGQDIGTWTVTWVRDWYGVRGRGPATSASAALTVVVVVVLSLCAAIASARRQQVAA